MMIRLWNANTGLQRGAAKDNFTSVALQHAVGEPGVHVADTNGHIIGGSG
jgi:hypothetical protein